MTGFIVFVLMSAAIWAALGCLTLHWAASLTTPCLAANNAYSAAGGSIKISGPSYYRWLCITKFPPNSRLIVN